MTRWCSRPFPRPQDRREYRRHRGRPAEPSLDPGPSPHACAHRLQPAPSRPAGGRPALHRRQRRSVRDCRVHPRHPSTRKPPRDIARDGRHPPGRLGRQGGRALPKECGVRVNAPRPGRDPPVLRRTGTHRAGRRPGTALAPRRTRITRCQQGMGSRRRRTRNPAGGNTARLIAGQAAGDLPSPKSERSCSGHDPMTDLRWPEPGLPPPGWQRFQARGPSRRIDTVR